MLGTTVCFIGIDQEDLSLFEMVYQQIHCLYRAGINVHAALKIANELKAPTFQEYKILKILSKDKIPFINIDTVESEHVSKKIIDQIISIKKTGGIVFVFVLKPAENLENCFNMVVRYINETSISFIQLDMTRDKYKTAINKFNDVILELFEQYKISIDNEKITYSPTFVSKKIHEFPSLSSQSQFDQRYRPKYYCNPVAFSLYRTKNFGNVKIPVVNELIKPSKSISKTLGLSILKRGLQLLYKS